MDNISIKFDRFFTGYSSDMKVLMDTFKKYNENKIIDQSFHSAIAPNRSFVSIASSPKFSNAIDEDPNATGQLYDKQYLRECKLRGLPLRKCYAKQHFKSTLNPYTESADSDSDLELFNLMHQFNEQKKRPAKKKSREMKRFLLASLQKGNRSDPPGLRARYRSDSELSVKSGNSLVNQTSSSSNRGVTTYNQTFDSYYAQKKGPLLARPTNLSDICSKSDILVKSRDYQLDANFAALLSRKKIKNYPMIFISRPEELCNTSKCI